MASYLHKGLKISFEDESEKTKETFEHSEGLLAYLRKIVGERGAKPVHDAAFSLEKQNGMRVDLVLQWTESTDEHIRSYVNGIPTGSGGTHENGIARGPRQGGAQLHRYAQPVAEGRDADRRGHPRGADRRAQRLRRPSRSFRGRPRIGSTTRKCCRRSIPSSARGSSTG